MRSVRGRQAGFIGGALAMLLPLTPWPPVASARPAFFAISAVTLNKGLERRQVAQAEHQWRQALLSGDAATLSGLLSDSYVGIGPDGTIFNKAEEIEASVSGGNRIVRIQVEERKIRIYGTTAVVTSRVDAQGTFASHPLVGQYRYTRVWAYGHGQWRVVSFEANRIDRSGSDPAGR